MLGILLVTLLTNNLVVQSEWTQYRMGVIISKYWRNTHLSEAYLLCAMHYYGLHALTYLLSPYEDDAIPDFTD